MAYTALIGLPVCGLVSRLLSEQCQFEFVFLIFSFELDSSWCMAQSRDS